MRLAFFVILLALATGACQTTTDPELEREFHYNDGIGP